MRRRLTRTLDWLYVQSSAAVSEAHHIETEIRHVLAQLDLLKG
jgi:hypothetical protein